MPHCIYCLLGLQQENLETDMARDMAELQLLLLASTKYIEEFWAHNF